MQAAITDYHRLCRLNKKHLFLSVLEPKKSKNKGPEELVCDEGHLHTVIPYNREREQAPMCLLIKALILFTRALPSGPNYLAKALPPNTIRLGVKISTYEFCGDTFIP